jgi:hypothetical protein
MRVKKFKQIATGFILFSASCFFEPTLLAQEASSIEIESTTFTEPAKTSWLGKFERAQKKLTKKLALQPLQLRKLDTLNDFFILKIANLYEKKVLTYREKRKILQGLKVQREAQFKEILTAPQLQQWEKMKKWRKKRAFKKR